MLVMDKEPEKSPEQEFEDLVELLMNKPITGASRFLRARWLEMAKVSAIDRCELSEEVVNEIVEKVRARTLKVQEK